MILFSACIVVLCIGFSLGWVTCTWSYLPVKNENGKYDVYDYSYPSDKMKIASGVSHRQASKLYWKNPRSRAIYLSM